MNNFNENFALTILMSTILISCSKKNDPALSEASLTTSTVTGITLTTAIARGNVSSDGGAAVTDRGACWSLGATPSVADNKISAGTGLGDFICNMTGLTPGTTYFVRAYATNSAGTAYGSATSFATLPVLVAEVTTSPITSIALSTALSGGSIAADGGAAITSRGICWSTGTVPTIADNKTSDGSGAGSFTSNLTGLTSGTTYSARAYATNSAGTGYGNTVVFTTLVSDQDGNIYHTVTIGKQIWMVENLKVTQYSDGTPIPLVAGSSADWAGLTTPGYCWYNNDQAINKDTYGALYNYYTVSTGKLCPNGWHVPSDTEWETLLSSQGASGGGKLKESSTTHWLAPNTGATNVSGFTALPGGLRYPLGSFLSLGQYGLWWSSTAIGPGNAANKGLAYNSDIGWFGASFLWQSGYSVRCIKD